MHYTRGEIPRMSIIPILSIVHSHRIWQTLLLHGDSLLISTKRCRTQCIFLQEAKSSCTITANNRATNQKNNYQVSTEKPTAHITIPCTSLNHCDVTSIIFFHFKMLPITTQTSLSVALSWLLIILQAVTTTGTASESKNLFHERITLFSTLTQNQQLNSPFLLHVSIQIEADTLYLVHINPGNPYQECSTIIYPMSLSVMPEQ